MKLLIRSRWEIALALASILPGLLTIRESLWIDELHTSWTCRGSWNEVAIRAAAGNQLPVYSWFMKLWLLMFGESEIAIRTPNLLCWFGCVWVTARTARPQLRKLRSWTPLLQMTMIGLYGMWLLFDRIGAFYSIEARPYAAVALCGSIMLARALITVSEAENNHGGRALVWSVDWVWIVAALFAIHLNPTSAFVVISTWFVKWILPTNESRRAITRSRVMEMIFVTVSTIPIWRFAHELSGRRDWWASFAGDASPTMLLSMLPILPWMLIPGLGLILRSLFVLRQRPNFRMILTRHRIAIGLLIAAIVPLLGVAVVTWAGIAPLAHRRYVIGAYPAVLLCGWCLMDKLPMPRWFLVGGLIALSFQIYQQDVWMNWQRGSAFGWQRHEDWKNAIQTLNEKFRLGERVVVAPNLIESESAETVAASDPDYLMFAVNAMYELRAPRPHLLLNRQELADQIDLATNCWFLLRVPPQRCERMIRKFGVDSKRAALASVEWISFGNLQLLRIRSDTEGVRNPEEFDRK